MEESARESLKSPRWWLTLVGVGAGVGAGYEGIAAALGDGDFNLGAVAQVAVPAIFVPVVVKALQALWPPD